MSFLLQRTCRAGAALSRLALCETSCMRWDSSVSGDCSVAKGQRQISFLLNAHEDVHALPVGFFQGSTHRALLVRAPSDAFRAQHSAADPESESRSQLAREVLQNISVRDLHTSLQDKAATHPVLSVDDMVSEIQKHHIASDPVEATRLLDALHTAGLVLRYNNIVYLDPKDVEDRVLRVLPDTSVADRKVQELQEELAPLNAQLDGIRRRAHLRSAVVAWGGFGLLVAQYVLFVRLTYWELSWDVMEPISFFTSQATVLACYMYFLATQKEFSYQNHFGTMQKRTRRTLSRQAEFDSARYEELTQDLLKWKRYAKAPQS